MLNCNTPTQALGNIRYFLTIVDDCTRWITCIGLKSKDEAFTGYVVFTTQLYTQEGIKVKELQSDNNTVF